MASDYDKSVAASGNLKSYKTQTEMSDRAPCFRRYAGWAHVTSISFDGGSTRAL